MKVAVIVTLSLFSFAACSKDREKKSELKKSAAVKAETKAEAPCDNKEDLIKKLEEKKKAEAEKSKGFSLQGGDSGCKVK